MIRLVSLPLIALAALIAPDAEAAALLKPSVVVTSGIVTLGDLIAGAGTKAGRAAFRAPDPGQTGNVSVEDVLDAAHRSGLIDVDTAGLRSVAVTRAGRLLIEDEIRVPVTAALAAELGTATPADLDIHLDEGFRTLHLPVEADGLASVETLSWHKELGTFDATIRVRRTDGTDERRTVRGRAVETEETVTITRSLERGVIVSATDVTIERRPKSEIQSDALFSADTIIGMQLKRALREGQIVRRADLDQPLLVKNGASVAVVLKAGNMTLTATVQALRDGRMGDTIQVMNAQSKRTLQAVVTGPNQVVVQPPRTLVSAAK